ncbi:MAG: peptide-methionine (S)-S-oxide reductase MsrA [Melioribacteraceae bacterium]
MTAIKIFLIILLINILNIDNELTKKSKENLMNSDKYEIATFGEGCFWCSEAIFQRVRGVLKVESGYSGGSVPNPTYEAVCTGKTGHAEVVQITFDPKIISFQGLLEIFFSTHDPTTLNRQGADVGTQYRSVIFYHNEEQKKIAEEMIKKLNESKIWDSPIVTEVSKFKNFYKAEEYHQNYYNNNQFQPYCSFVISPKLEKLKKYFSNKLK